MRDFFRKLLLPLTYARRDLRAGLRGFYVFLACLVLGVATIAGIQSLSRGLVESLHHDGRYILGGDVALRTVYEPATAEQIRFLHDKMGPVTVVMETRAMARRMDDAQSTLVELKAVDPFYPLYGEIKVADENGKDVLKKDILQPLQDILLPPAAEKGGQERDEWGAVIEKELLTRLHLRIGDWVRIGEQKFQLRGIITKEPDRISGNTFSLAPRVMISINVFDRTGLRKQGSQVYFDHRVLMPYVKTFEDLRAAEKKIAEAFPDAAWKGRDFLSAAPRVERLVNRLTLFFTLIGLTTLLIGGVGISNAVRGFLEAKLPDIATLKCLGGSDTFVFRVYTTQITALATLGIAAGLALGAAAAQLAGSLLTARLSLSDQVSFYPQALLLAAAFGYLTTFCFSLWPVGRAIRVPPNDLFRDKISPGSAAPSLNVMLMTLISAQALALLAILSASDRLLVVYFVAATFATFAVFYGYSAFIKTLVKKLRLPRLPELRMAVANLYRPGNISTSIILSLGLGLTVLVAVALVQFNFSRMISEDITPDSPSFFFLDILPDQKEDFTKLVNQEASSRGLTMTPSLRGRITLVNGRKAEDALVDPNEAWVINSDRGITYTDTLPAYSTVVAGEWWKKDYDGPPAVSIATNVARAFGIGVGDALTVNILGLDITATVANVREINWGSFTMNFAVTFAPGVLEKAPATHIATVIVDPDHEESLQNSIARKLPNVTAVRVRDALETAQTFIRAIAQAISISAGVTLLSGTLVLSGGIAAARRRHLYDSIILKVLGATRRRILLTFLFEYAMLGLLTAVIAAGLGTAAAWAIQAYVLNIEWNFEWLPLAGVTLLCLLITLLAGFIGTWRALRQKPAPYLRNQ